MKRVFFFILAFCNLPILLAGQIGMYQHGSVVRMHMGDCMLAHHGMTVAFGPPAIPSQDSCPSTRSYPQMWFMSLSENLPTSLFR